MPTEEEDEPNPYMHMTEEELLASCANDDGARRAIQLVEDWLRTRTTPPPSTSTKVRRRRRTYIERGREEGHARLFHDYFSDSPAYTADQFRRKFRMRRHVFLRVVEALGAHSEYFRARRNACGRSGLSALQKCTAAVSTLAYGVTGGCADGYVPIGETTVLECVRRFAKGVNELFGEEYLRGPNDNDVVRLLGLGESRGLPGLMGCVGFMHWEWRNCPDKWKSLYVRGGEGKPVIMAEMVASEDLWIWHAFFGCPRANGNLDVFGSTPGLDRVYEGWAPRVEYKVNGRDYDTGYYFTDGIYPEWPTFVKAIPNPQHPKEELFNERHEEARKNVERALRLLQSRFAIMQGPGRVWDRDALRDIICACIILHNMIIEDEREIRRNDDSQDEYVNPSNVMPMPTLRHSPLHDYETYLQTVIQIRDEGQHHHQLQADLAEHLWQTFKTDS